jgi:flavodoxin I
MQHDLETGRHIGVKALVVYDSVYGNTEKIAQEIGGALSSEADVRVVRVSDAKPEDLIGLDVLLVGSPTHGGRPTSAMRAWLKDLARHSLQGVRTAGFDTRGDLSGVNSGLLKSFVGMIGYAAERVARQLVKRGGSQGVPPAGFLVMDREGPLKEGELERAAAWARQIL